MRLFIAINPPLDVREALETWRRRLEGIFSGHSLRWARAEDLHLTLRFLGESSEPQRSAMDRLMKEAAAAESGFSVRLGGLGCFPPHGMPRVLWLGVRDGDESLVRFVSTLETGVQALGFAAEKHDYHPHMTLARITRANGRSFSEQMGQAPTFEAAFETRAIDLMQSHLSAKGACYETLASFPFRRG